MLDSDIAQVQAHLMKKDRLPNAPSFTGLMRIEDFEALIGKAEEKGWI